MEIKNSTIGEYTAVAHLTYIGDSDVGSNVNFGCGVVTVNYNGDKKFRTVIEDNAFIGCNTNLVAQLSQLISLTTHLLSSVAERLSKRATLRRSSRREQKSSRLSTASLRRSNIPKYKQDPVFCKAGSFICLAFCCLSCRGYSRWIRHRSRLV